MAAEKILVSDTLDSGFRVKYNATVDTLINGNATVDNDGIIYFPKVDGSNWSIDIRSKFLTSSEVSALVNPAIRQATETITGQVRKSTLQELVDGDSDFAYVSATGLKYMMDRWETLPHESFSIGESTFYINDVVDGDGVTHYSLGLDTYELMIEGDLEMAGKISVGQGYPIIQKKRDESDGEMKAYINADYSPLELVSTNINVNGILGVGTIESLDSNPIIVNSPIQFNYDIILGGSAGLDHQFWKYNGLTYEWAYINLGEIQKTIGDENYLIKTGSSTLEKSVIYETSGRIGIGNLATDSNYKVNITGSLNVSSKLYINGDFGADHKFLKSNGVSQEFAYINLGEIQKTSGDENYLVKTGSTTLTKSRLFDNGTFFGLGTDTAITGYDIILNGTSYVNGNLNVHGKLYINESFGADHAFLKSNGTTQEWAVINTGELSDVLDLVMLVTDEGERGFKMYSDANKTVLEGFVFTNSDTGVFGLHGYRLNGSDTEQYGLQIDKDTFLYHVLPSGVRYRILTTNDNVTTGGGGSGTYSASSPLFITQENHNIYIQKATSLDNGYLSASDWSIFNGKQDLLSNASGSVTGKLTSTDWTTFNNKLGDTSKVNTYLDFDDSATLYFNKNPSSTQSTGKIYSSNYNGGADLDLVITSQGVGADIVLLTGSTLIAKTGATYSSPFTELDLGTNDNNYLIKLNGTAFNFKLASTPIDGDRFVIRYSTSRGGMILEAE